LLFLAKVRDNVPEFRKTGKSFFVPDGNHFGKKFFAVPVKKSLTLKTLFNIRVGLFERTGVRF